MTCVIYPSALASEASTLDCVDASKASEQWLWWNGKPSASRTWSQRCKRVNWMQHLSTRIFTDSLGQSIEDAWILSAADFLASRSVKQVFVRRPKILDTCGPSSNQGLLFSDLALASSRMLTGSSTHQVRDTIQFCTMSSATWNDWVSDRRQAALRRQKLAHLTRGADGSSSAFATPTAHLCKEAGYPAEHNRNTPTLTAQVQSLGLQSLEASSTDGKHRVLLNPTWVDQLMGFPTDWTDLERWATPSYPAQQPKHSQPYGTN